ncbi:unnamed protein product [Paramecium pentaurelia]|uniref:Uncharacterized protein n=1 Tax=Paramecium pentaurelia TaxID=43138 RepID=A0A8S1V5F9_9CILI|nr:unnamed protein product [Paramecium pentaurelia]
MDKETKNSDEITQQLNGIAQKFQEENIQFTYKFMGEWVPQETEKVSFTIDTQKLSFHIKGKDPYGTWNQIGLITINKSNQVETFSRKLYDDSYLHGGDVLIYYGQYDNSIQTFSGNWYYLEGQQKGEWSLKFQIQ